VLDDLDHGLFGGESESGSNARDDSPVGCLQFALDIDFLGIDKRGMGGLGQAVELNPKSA